MNRYPDAWTGPSAIKAKARRLWETGRLGSAALGGEPELFPLRIALKGPASRDWARHLLEIQAWVADLQAAASGWDLEWREVAHRELGRNRLPVAAVLRDAAAALELLGKAAQGRRLLALRAALVERWPTLDAWCVGHPHQLLEWAEEWPTILACLDWFAAHPRPGCYARQIDAPGVHGKFVERQRGLLASLLVLAVPATVVEAAPGGAEAFNRRFGLLDKPALVRLRFLDPALAPDLGGAWAPSELSLRSEEFADQLGGLLLPQGLRQVLVLENEITWLALPPLAGTLAILGSGYGFAHLATARWLERLQLWYWGDLDSHGLAILNQFRGLFPAARSLLMDRATLLAHRALWTAEPSPAAASLTHLTPDEAAVRADLASLQPGRAIRLEQERIGWSWMVAALKRHLAD